MQSMEDKYSLLTEPSSIGTSDAIDRRGRRKPETLDRIDRRNQHARLMRDEMYPGASDREAARRIRNDLLLYRTGAWRRDASANECPTRSIRDEHCWRILKAIDYVPSEKTVANAIKAIRFAENREGC